MYKSFATKKFWYSYLAICALSCVLAVLLSNLFGLGGQDIADTSLKNTYFAILFLLLPAALFPGFLLIAILQKLKH